MFKNPANPNEILHQFFIGPRQGSGITSNKSHNEFKNKKVEHVNTVDMNEDDKEFSLQESEKFQNKVVIPRMQQYWDKDLEAYIIRYKRLREWLAKI